MPVPWWRRSELSATRKTAQTLAGHLLVFVQGLVLTPVVIKVAGPETFGGYVLLISYMSIMFGISSMGVGVSAKRWLPSTSGVAERAAMFYPQFWFQILSVFFLAIFSATVFAALATSRQWQFPGFSAWMVPAYLLAYTLYSQATDYFRYTHRVGMYNISTVAQPYLFVFLAIAIYWTAGVLNIGTLVASLTIACTAVGGFLFLQMYREIGLQLRLPERHGLGAELKMGFPLVLSYLVDVMLSGGDRYIIAAILSVRDVGIYVPAYALGSLVMVLPKVFGVVLPPLISRRIDAGDEAGAKRLSDGAARIFLLVSIPYVAGAAILGKDILRLYANSEVAESTWPVISIVALASIFYGLILIKANILFVRLKTRVIFQINLVSVVLNILLNIVLLKLFGNVIVAAVATLSSYLLSYILLSRKLTGDVADFVLDMPWLFRVFLCSAGMSLVLAFMTSASAYHGLTAVGFGVCVGGAVYAILTLVQRSNRTDLALLARSMRMR